MPKTIFTIIAVISLLASWHASADVSGFMIRNDSSKIRKFEIDDGRNLYVVRLDPGKLVYFIDNDSKLDKINVTQISLSGAVVKDTSRWIYYNILENGEMGTGLSNSPQINKIEPDKSSVILYVRTKSKDFTVRNTK